MSNDQETKNDGASPFTKEDLEAMEKDVQAAKESLAAKAQPAKDEVDAVKLKEELRNEILADLKKQEAEKAKQEAENKAEQERVAALNRVKELEEKMKGFSESKAVVKPNNPFSQDENTEIRASPEKIALREQELMEAMFAHRPK